MLTTLVFGCPRTAGLWRYLAMLSVARTEIAIFWRIEQSIVNKAIVNSKLNTMEVLLVHITGDFKGNAKIVQTSGPFGFIGGDPNDCAFGGQLLFF